MFKYAFIVNSKKQSPETYSGRYTNSEFDFYIAATHDLQQVKDLAKDLAKDGFQLIDLCGDFGAAEANKVAAMSGIDVCYAKYTPEEGRKLDDVDSLSEYGIVVMCDGILEGRIERIDLSSAEFNTHVRLVGTDKDAAEAARELVAEGISFIELCSYFDAKMNKDIIEAIDGKVPVGYCG